VTLVPGSGARSPVDAVRRTAPLPGASGVQFPIRRHRSFLPNPCCASAVNTMT